MRSNNDAKAGALGGVDVSLVEARQLITEAERLTEEDPPAAAKLLRQACKRLSKKKGEGRAARALLLAQAKLLLSDIADSAAARGNYVRAALDHGAEAVEETPDSPVAVESWMMALAVANLKLDPADLWDRARRMATFAQERFEAGEQRDTARRLWLATALTLARAAEDSPDQHIDTRIDAVIDVWDSIVAHMPEDVEALTTAAMVRRMVASRLAQSDRAAARRCLLEAVHGLDGLRDVSAEDARDVYVAQADALCDLAMDLAGDMPERASYLARAGAKLEAAVKARPDDYMAWDYLGWVCLEHGGATDDPEARETDAGRALEVAEHLLELDADPDTLEHMAASVLAAAANWLPDTSSCLALLRQAADALRLIDDDVEDQPRLLALRATIESLLARRLLLDSEEIEEGLLWMGSADQVYQRLQAMEALDASSLLNWGHGCLVAAEEATDADEKTCWYRRACTRCEQASRLAPGDPGLLLLWSIALTGAARTSEHVSDRTGAMRLAAEKAAAAVEASPEIAAPVGRVVLSLSVGHLAISDDYDQPSVLPALGRLRNVLDKAGCEIPLIIRSRLDAALGLEDEAIESLRSALGVGSLTPEDLEDDLLLAALRDRPEFAELQELHTPGGSSSGPRGKRSSARSPLDRPLPGLESELDEPDESA
ncbi:MAG: hypothetical protein ACP5KN_14870 [Armatimonadota bacterium]